MLRWLLILAAWGTTGDNFPTCWIVGFGQVHVIPLSDMYVPNEFDRCPFNQRLATLRTTVKFFRDGSSALSSEPWKV